MLVSRSFTEDIIQLTHRTVGLWEMIQVMAGQYDQNIVPSITDQGKLLEGLIVSRTYTANSVRLWRPCFGLWTGWCCASAASRPPLSSF